VRVLFIAMQWDYKNQAQGESFEYTNFWDTLRRMSGVEAELFPFDDIERRIGREAMNKALLVKAQEWKPDVAFFVFFQNEFDASTVKDLSKICPTINWFADDQWRFHSFSKHWAPHLSWVATTYRPAAESYIHLGYRNVLLTQWGCNHWLYRPIDVERDLDCTFIGQAHGDRRELIARLRADGQAINTWGSGWESGRLPQTQMIEMFSRTKVNLNLSNASISKGIRPMASILLQRKGRLVVLRKDMIGKFREFRDRRSDQIKGRNFEIPGCKTLLLTAEVDGLEEYFEFGKEIVTFRGFDDLVAKIRRYLTAEDEREEIARMGYERTLRDHTYEIRFTQMFEKMGLR
jgi:spore maturation protein CgeB